MGQKIKIWRKIIMPDEDDEEFIDKFMESREYKLGTFVGQPIEPPPEPEDEE